MKLTYSKQSAGAMTDCMMIRWICKKRFRKWWYNLFRHKGLACYSSPRYCYTIGYRFALACFHGKCRKKVILDFFYESTDAESNGVCCDCCDDNFSNMVAG